MLLHIGNMVCDRCIMVVRSTLEQLGLQPEQVRLGQVRLRESVLDTAMQLALRSALEKLGFQLIGERKAVLTEQVKVAIIELVHRDNAGTPVKYSEYLSELLGMDYTYISKTFSESEGMTLEQYIIRQKIEKVKEWLTYGQLTLSEIAWQMGYSSVAALSSQFKKVTGMTPSHYKEVRPEDRKPLDRIGKTDS